MKIFFIVFISTYCVVNNQRTFENDQVLQLITTTGYQGESHIVETDDGYILKLHRLVPRNPNGKKPILIMHGILATAADFLVTGKDVGLAYLLSDHGYDVWLGNSRGSKHSSKHSCHPPDSEKYWQFSWNEMGLYDAPAMIDYILEQTGFPKIYYIAHSQGTTSFLVLLSSRPEYNQKIKQAHLMAPPAFRKKLPKSYVVLFFLRFLDRHEEIKFLELRRLFRVGNIIGNTICRDDDLFVFKLCKKLIKATFGGNSSKQIEIETKLLPNLIHYLSPRVSTMQLTHYYQNMLTNKFRQFDYKYQNYDYYNATEPPEYKLSNIDAPIYLYHAAFDNFITEKGAAYLKSLLPNVQKYRVVSNWNHIDFVYSQQARDVLYNDILRSIELQ